MQELALAFTDGKPSDSKAFYRYNSTSGLTL